MLFAAPALAGLASMEWPADRALAVVELATEEDFAPPDRFEIIDERRYGDTRIVFLRWSP